MLQIHHYFSTHLFYTDANCFILNVSTNGFPIFERFPQEELFESGEGLNREKANIRLKVTVQFERCFRLMEHISVISCRNPINLYITEKLIEFSKSLFYLYLLMLNK